MDKPTVNTNDVVVDTLHAVTFDGEKSVRATLWPTDHPRKELNMAPWVNSSEVQEIHVITRNTHYVWKKNKNNAEDVVPSWDNEGAL